MSAPVLLSVILSMQTALQGITRANGFFYDVKSTSVRTKPENLQVVDTMETPIVLVGHDLQPVGREFKSRPNSVQERWKIVLAARIDTVSDDATGFIAAFEQFTDDLERAVTWPVNGKADIYGGLVMSAVALQPMPYFGLIAQNQIYLEQPVEILLQRTTVQP